MSKRPKMESPTALALLTPARVTRERITEGSEFAPTVLFAPRHGQAVMAILAGEGRLPDELSVLLGEMRARLGPAEWIAVTTDAYSKAVDDPDGHVPGSLEEAFKAGDPTVTEQMMVVLQQRNKPVEVAAQAYRFIPSEGYEWDEPEVMYDHRSVLTAVLDYYI